MASPFFNEEFYTHDRQNDNNLKIKQPVFTAEPTLDEIENMSLNDGESDGLEFETPAKFGAGTKSQVVGGQNDLLNSQHTP